MKVISIREARVIGREAVEGMWFDRSLEELQQAHYALICSPKAYGEYRVMLDSLTLAISDHADNGRNAQ